MLLLAGCTGEGADDGAATPASTGPTLTAPADPDAPPDQPGPWPVGRTERTVVDAARGDRALPVTIWYPAATDLDTASLVPSTYTFVDDVGVDSAIGWDDAPPAPGAFPLIVFSHGNGGMATQSTFLTEALASHGFVVAAPEHVGNTATDMVVGTDVSQTQSAVERPGDVSAVIDALLAAGQDPDDLLGGTVADGPVGVTGHSFGGLTTLALAVEADGVPADPRVGAIAPIAPASFPIGDEALASITVPVLLVGGTLDETTPIDPEVARPWALVSSTEAHRVDVDGAGHLSFSNLCSVADEYLSRPDAEPAIAGYVEGLADEGCGPVYAPPDRVHDLTQRYVVAFFRSTLSGDAPYEAFLSPAAGVGYQRGG